MDLIFWLKFARVILPYTSYIDHWVNFIQVWHKVLFPKTMHAPVWLSIAAIHHEFINQ